MYRRSLGASIASAFLLLAGCSSSGGGTVVTVLGYTVGIKTAPPTTAPAGTSIPIAFTATENESDGTSKPAGGRSFTVVVTAGGGTVNGGASVTLTTGTDGSASLTWLLGPVTGTQTVRGSVSSIQYLDVNVTATPPAVASVSVSLPSASIVAGSSEVASATPRDATGNALAGRTITWLSSSSTTATVNASGLVTAVAPGTTTISATSEGTTGSASLTVVPVPLVVTTVNVTLPIAALEVNAVATASAVVLDQNNAAMIGKTVTWSSDNTSVATVASDGVVTGIAAGTANIIATVDGKQGRTGTTITSWTFEGVVLSNADFGNAPGPLADVSVLALLDGRYRMIIGGFPNSPGGFGSAISSDGVHFALESGVRLSTPVQIGADRLTFVKPVAIRMDDGRIRLFASANVDATGGIYSFTSADEGMTFTVDPGVRLTLAATGLAQLGTSSLVKVNGGGWRMYINDNPGNTPNGQLGSPKLLSAFSQDLTTFVMDAGVRVGTGATLSGAAQSAGAVLNADGSTTIVYFRNNPGSTYQSTSVDGLTFSTEFKTGFGFTDRFQVPAIDAYLLPLANGTVRMYFNYSGTTGAIYTAHHPAFLIK